MTLGEIVKKYRTENKMTMETFAEKARLSKGYISMLEKNEHPRTKKAIAPSLEVIEKISSVIDMDINEIIELMKGEIILLEKDHFTTIEDAMLFLLSNPLVSAYGGYDFDRMTDEEKIQFANKMMGVLKMVADDYK